MRIILNFVSKTNDLLINLGRANTARNWRDGGSERDRDKEQSDISSEGAVKDRRWTSRVPATHTRRQNPGRKDENLPEWFVILSSILQ